MKVIDKGFEQEQKTWHETKCFLKASRSDKKQTKNKELSIIWKIAKLLGINVFKIKNYNVKTMYTQNTKLKTAFYTKDLSAQKIENDQHLPNLQKYYNH